MTTQITPEPPQTAAPMTAQPRSLEYLPLDGSRWNAWVEKNERLDKVSRARRIRAIAVLLSLLAAAALIQRVVG